MIDGLYRVQRPSFSAGFVVKDGNVTHCAPILRKQLRYWVTQAELVQADQSGTVPGSAQREAEPA